MRPISTAVLCSACVCAAGLLACAPKNGDKEPGDGGVADEGAAEDTAAQPGDSGDPSPRCAPPDPDPAPTREGHPSDGWRWTKQGVLFPDGDPVASGDGDLGPTLVNTGDGLHLVYTRQQGSTQTLWWSTSDDGLVWSSPEAATGIEAGTGDTPSLLHDGDGFRMWYGSGSIDHATSPDGRAFSPTGTVLRTPDAGDFASLSLIYPRAIATDGGLDLYYTGFDGARFAIGLVESIDDGGIFGVPSLVLERDEEGWDNAAVAMPMPVDLDGARLLWFGGYDTATTNPGPWRVGLLRGGERRVSLPLAEEGPDAWSTRDPAVVRWGDGWLMVYVGMGDDGVYRLMAASSDVCP